MASDLIHFDIVELQGFLTIIAYFNYFSPGTLKVQTRVHKLNPYKLNDVLVNFDQIKSTRRWLQKGESPYPGYCRAPGSEICQPVLCNCKKLTETWNRVKYTESKLKRPGEVYTNFY